MRNMRKSMMYLFALLLLMAAMTARAENVTFTVCSWDDTNKQVVKTQTTKDCIIIDGHSDEWQGLGEKDKETWYAVKDYHYVSRDVLNIFGTVHLVLADYSNLSCHHIKLEAQNNAKLHIHNINGDALGNIEVKNWYERVSYGDFYEAHYFYMYYIGAAAVGGGQDQNMGSLYMHGGTLSASIQDEKPAAIGGGMNGSIDPAHEIVVYAGVLKGEAVYSSHVDMQEPHGAAIGGSDDHPQGGPVTVYGGTLWAICNSRGAGIGGGEDSYGGTVKVYGGNVRVERNVSSNKSGKNIALKGGAGIGGGYEGSGGDVHIYGGTVEVAGGMENYAIGGYDNDGKGTLEIAANMRVTAGGYDYDTGTASPECVFTNAERVPACMYRRWAKVEVCDHTPQNGDAPDVATTYSIDDEIYHTKHCRYCNATIQEKHADENCVCGVKNGTYQFTIYVPGTEKNTYVEGTTTTVGAGKKFYLPECTNVPAGYIFKGWEMNPETTDSWAAVKGGDLGSDINVPAGTSVEAILGQDQTTSFYARFIYDLGWVTDWDDNSPTTGTMVTISHPDITTWTLTPGNYSNGNSLNIDFEAWKDDNDQEIGTHYVARVTYILNGYEYTYDSMKDVLNLGNDAAINKTISSLHGIRADVTLKDRTLYKDGMWNTLCLPFNVVDNDPDDGLTFTGTPLEGATVVTVTNASIQSKQLNLEYSDPLQKLDAGVPYLVKWETPGDNIVDPVFTAVTLKDKLSPVNAGALRFVGIFEPTLLPANSKDILYIGADGKLYYPDADVTLGAFRGFFEVMFGGDDGATGIIGINGKRDAAVSGIYYDLQGRKVLHPTKGLYIVNGRKVVVK